uniref:IQ calmodulin-binding motif domain-containing protein, putative n=1 Tax=Neospora caninum (strain Liverpool) TaxID=572307 RepID=A0A0F7UNF1_NEOCL|nr:TPA: IQ calmodulin-binding motif domain-containing protein, putative [Neospora caninum Liverpool]
MCRGLETSMGDSYSSPAAMSIPLPGRADGVRRDERQDASAFLSSSRVGFPPRETRRTRAQANFPHHDRLPSSSPLPPVLPTPGACRRSPSGSPMFSAHPHSEANGSCQPTLDAGYSSAHAARRRSRGTHGSSADTVPTWHTAATRPHSLSPSDSPFPPGTRCLPAVPRPLPPGPYAAAVGITTQSFRRGSEAAGSLRQVSASIPLSPPLSEIPLPAYAPSVGFSAAQLPPVEQRQVSCAGRRGRGEESVARVGDSASLSLPRKTEGDGEVDGGLSFYTTRTPTTREGGKSSQPTSQDSNASLDAAGDREGEAGTDHDGEQKGGREDDKARDESEGQPRRELLWLDGDTVRWFNEELARKLRDYRAKQLHAAAKRIQEAWRNSARRQREREEELARLFAQLRRVERAGKGTADSRGQRTQEAERDRKRSGRGRGRGKTRERREKESGQEGEERSRKTKREKGEKGEKRRRIKSPARAAQTIQAAFRGFRVRRTMARVAEEGRRRMRGLTGGETRDLPPFSLSQVERLDELTQTLLPLELKVLAEASFGRPARSGTCASTRRGGGDDRREGDRGEGEDLARRRPTRHSARERRRELRAQAILATEVSTLIARALELRRHAEEERSSSPQSVVPPGRQERARQKAARTVHSRRQLEEGNDSSSLPSSSSSSPVASPCWSLSLSSDSEREEAREKHERRDGHEAPGKDTTKRKKDGTTEIHRRKGQDGREREKSAKGRENRGLVDLVVAARAKRQKEKKAWGAQEDEKATEGAKKRSNRRGTRDTLEPHEKLKRNSHSRDGGRGFADCRRTGRAAGEGPEAADRLAKHRRRGDRACERRGRWGQCGVPESPPDWMYPPLSGAVMPIERLCPPARWTPALSPAYADPSQMAFPSYVPRSPYVGPMHICANRQTHQVSVSMTSSSVSSSSSFSSTSSSSFLSFVASQSKSGANERTREEDIEELDESPEGPETHGAPAEAATILAAAAAVRHLGPFASANFSDSAPSKDSRQSSASRVSLAAQHTAPRGLPQSPLHEAQVEADRGAGEVPGTADEAERTAGASTQRTRLEPREKEREEAETRVKQLRKHLGQELARREEDARRRSLVRLSASPLRLSRKSSFVSLSPSRYVSPEDDDEKRTAESDGQTGHSERMGGEEGLRKELDRKTEEDGTAPVPSASPFSGVQAEAREREERRERDRILAEEKVKVVTGQSQLTLGEREEERRRSVLEDRRRRILLSASVSPRSDAGLFQIRVTKASSVDGECGKRLAPGSAHSPSSASFVPPSSHSLSSFPQSPLRSRRLSGSSRTAALHDAHASRRTQDASSRIDGEKGDPQRGDVSAAPGALSSSSAGEAEEGEERTVASRLEPGTRPLLADVPGADSEDAEKANSISSRGRQPPLHAPTLRLPLPPPFLVRPRRSSSAGTPEGLSASPRRAARLGVQEQDPTETRGDYRDRDEDAGKEMDGEKTEKGQNESDKKLFFTPSPSPERFTPPSSPAVPVRSPVHAGESSSLLLAPSACSASSSFSPSVSLSLLAQHDQVPGTAAGGEEATDQGENVGLAAEKGETGTKERNGVKQTVPALRHLSSQSEGFPSIPPLACLPVSKETDTTQQQGFAPASVAGRSVHASSFAIYPVSPLSSPRPLSSHAVKGLRAKTRGSPPCTEAPAAGEATAEIEKAANGDGVPGPPEEPEEKEAGEESPASTFAPFQKNEETAASSGRQKKDLKKRGSKQAGKPGAVGDSVFRPEGEPDTTRAFSASSFSPSFLPFTSGEPRPSSPGASPPRLASAPVPPPSDPAPGPSPLSPVPSSGPNEAAVENKGTPTREKRGMARPASPRVSPLVSPRPLFSLREVRAKTRAPLTLSADEPGQQGEKREGEYETRAAGAQIEGKQAGTENGKKDGEEVDGPDRAGAWRKKHEEDELGRKNEDGTTQRDSEEKRRPEEGEVPKQETTEARKQAVPGAGGGAEETLGKSEAGEPVETAEGRRGRGEESPKTVDRVQAPIEAAERIRTATEDERKKKEEDEKVKNAQQEGRRTKEEAEQRAVEELRIKEEEEMRKKEEEEKRRKNEEDRKKKEEEARLKKAQEEERKKTEEAERRKKEEEGRKKKTEEERRKKEEEEKRRKNEEDRKKKEEEARLKKAQEEERKKTEEAERRKKEEEERRKKEEKEMRTKEEEEKRRKNEEDRKKKEEEARLKKAQEEERKKTEEAERRKKEEEERRKKEEKEMRTKEEEEKRRKNEEDRKKKEEEARLKKAQEEERKKTEEAERRKKEEEERRKKEEKEMRTKEEEEKRRKNEEDRKKQEEEARLKKAQEEERRKKAEEERGRKNEEDRKKKEEEATLKKEQEEERKKTEEEERRKKEEEGRKKKTEEERRKKEQEEERKKAEEERRKKEEEEGATKTQEEARLKKAQEADRTKKEGEEGTRKKGGKQRGHEEKQREDEQREKGGGRGRMQQQPGGETGNEVEKMDDGERRKEARKEESNQKKNEEEDERRNGEQRDERDTEGELIRGVEEPHAKEERSRRGAFDRQEVRAKLRILQKAQEQQDILQRQQERSASLLHRRVAALRIQRAWRRHRKRVFRKKTQEKKALSAHALREQEQKREEDARRERERRHEELRRRLLMAEARRREEEAAVERKVRDDERRRGQGSEDETDIDKDEQRRRKLQDEQERAHWGEGERRRGSAEDEACELKTQSGRRAAPPCLDGRSPVGRPRQRENGSGEQHPSLFSRYTLYDEEGGDFFSARSKAETLEEEARRAGVRMFEPIVQEPGGAVRRSMTLYDRSKGKNEIRKGMREERGAAESKSEPREEHRSSLRVDQDHGKRSPPDDAAGALTHGSTMSLARERGSLTSEAGGPASGERVQKITEKPREERVSTARESSDDLPRIVLHMPSRRLSSSSSEDLSSDNEATENMSDDEEGTEGWSRFSPRPRAAEEDDVRRRIRRMLREALDEKMRKSAEMGVLDGEDIAVTASHVRRLSNLPGAAFQKRKGDNLPSSFRRSATLCDPESVSGRECPFEPASASRVGSESRCLEDRGSQEKRERNDGGGMHRSPSPTSARSPRRSSAADSLARHTYFFQQRSQAVEGPEEVAERKAISQQAASTLRDSANGRLGFSPATSSSREETDPTSCAASVSSARCNRGPVAPGGPASSHTTFHKTGIKNKKSWLAPPSDSLSEEEPEETAPPFVSQANRERAVGSSSASYASKGPTSSKGSELMKQAALQRESPTTHAVARSITPVHSQEEKRDDRFSPEKPSRVVLKDNKLRSDSVSKAVQISEAAEMCSKHVAKTAPLIPGYGARGRTDRVEEPSSVSAAGGRERSEAVRGPPVGQRLAESFSTSIPVAADSDSKQLPTLIQPVQPTATHTVGPPCSSSVQQRVRQKTLDEDAPCGHADVNSKPPSTRHSPEPHVVYGGPLSGGRAVFTEARSEEKAELSEEKRTDSPGVETSRKEPCPPSPGSQDPIMTLGEGVRGDHDGEGNCLCEQPECPYQASVLAARVEKPRNVAPVEKPQRRRPSAETPFGPNAVPQLSPRGDGRLEGSPRRLSDPRVPALLLPDDFLLGATGHRRSDWAVVRRQT